MPPLLAPGEPPPVTVVNRDGSARCLLLCDHASNRVPHSLGQLGLPQAELDRHIGYDIGAAWVTRRLAETLDAPAILSGYSRLVLDLNRALNDPACFPEVSDGTPVPANQGLTPEEKGRRAAALFHPYHDAVRAEVRRFVERGVAPVILSMHSFTPFMRGFVRPWHIGVLWHEDGRIARPLLDALYAIEGICVGDNEPYSAREPASFTVEHHSAELGLAHVGIEVKQDLIDTEEGARRWADLLRDAFLPILAEETLYRLGG